MMPLLRLVFIVAACLGALTLASFSSNGERDAVHDTQSDNTKSSAMSVLDFVVNSIDSAELAKRESYFFPSVPPRRDAGVKALDVIFNAYDSTGYYSSGTWSRDEYILYPAAVTPPVSGVRFLSARPVVITSPFGYRKWSGRMHYGVDIAMQVGDSVRVAMPGAVSNVAYDARGYGHYVIVVHDNGLETRYAHLSRPLVAKGDRVAEGSVVALSGSTGNSTGPHLHLETRYRGVPVDPRVVFSFF